MLSHFFKLRKALPRRSRATGFTILEMMVVIAIVTVMTGVLLGNLPNFRDRTTLQLVAQDVAVTIRQAQVFGIGTKIEYDAGGDAVFLGHGMYFCDPAIDLCRKNFLLFSDDDNDEIFSEVDVFNDSGTVDWAAACDTEGECRDIYSITGNIEICALKVNGTEEANGVGIAFDRVYSDAFIKEGSNTVNENNAKIYLHSKKDFKERVVTVYNTGGITVEAVPDDARVCTPPINP